MMRRRDASISTMPASASEVHCAAQGCNRKKTHRRERSSNVRISELATRGNQCVEYGGHTLSKGSARTTKIAVAATARMFRSMYPARDARKTDMRRDGVVRKVEFGITPNAACSNGQEHQQLEWGQEHWFDVR